MASRTPSLKVCVDECGGGTEEETHDAVDVEVEVELELEDPDDPDPDELDEEDLERALRPGDRRGRASLAGAGGSKPGTRPPPAREQAGSCCEGRVLRPRRLEMASAKRLLCL